MKIYKIRVLCFPFPGRAFIFSDICSCDIHQRYFYQTWWVGMIASADWLIIFIPKDDVSRATVFHQTGQGHVISRIKTCVRWVDMYLDRDSIRQIKSWKKSSTFKFKGLFLRCRLMMLLILYLELERCPFRLLVMPIARAKKRNRTSPYKDTNRYIRSVFCIQDL